LASEQRVCFEVYARAVVEAARELARFGIALDCGRTAAENAELDEQYRFIHLCQLLPAEHGWVSFVARNFAGTRLELLRLGPRDVAGFSEIRQTPWDELEPMLDPAVDRDFARTEWEQYAGQVRTAQGHPCSAHHQLLDPRFVMSKLLDRSYSERLESFRRTSREIDAKIAAEYWPDHGFREVQGGSPGLGRRA
jgi:hypothetical protein